MCAALGDDPPVHHENLVGMADRTEPVRDEQHRFSLNQAGDRVLNERLVLRVLRGRRLVEYDDRRVFEKHPGERNALPLACGEMYALAIRRMKPVELLRESHTAEREPKIKWVLLILGVLSLGAGYFIALTTKSPLEALLMFFAAVILVILGTYCLFVTGTTFVLKCLKRNKRYYYNKRHMPAVAGLLFRMKQNAVGLASIAILATGVLVMISTTVSLYSGVEDTMETNYPEHLYLSAYRQNGDAEEHVSFDELSRIVVGEMKKVDGQKQQEVKIIYNFVGEIPE